MEIKTEKFDYTPLGLLALDKFMEELGSRFISFEYTCDDHLFTVYYEASKYDCIRGKEFRVSVNSQEEFASFIQFFTSRGFEWLSSKSATPYLTFRVPVR